MPNHRSSFERFHFDVRVELGAIKDDLVAIEAHRLSINKLFLPPEWLRDLQRLFIVRSVHGTTAIEGNPLSEDDVARQLYAGDKPSRKDQLHRQTANAFEAFKWIEREFASQRPIRFEDLLALHRLLTTESDHRDNTPGRLRESGHNVTVGSLDLGGVHRPPPGGPKLRALVDRFLDFINSAQFHEQHTVVQALVAHFYFVTLHPFGDGNGRTTRCIEAAILHGGKYNTYGFYSLSNFFYRNRDDYFRLLQETRTKYRYDLTHFVLFGVRGFREELERINAYVRNRIHRLQYRELIRRSLDKRVGKRRRLLNKREAEVLHQILDHTKPSDPFSNEPAKKLDFEELWPTIRVLYKGKTPRTAARELTRLEQLGFLIIEGGRFEESKFRIDFAAISRY